MSLVLYRKYRPQTFSEIIGQEHVVQTLTNAISSGMISHAYLFCGPHGCGKTTIARLLAKAVNCQNRKGFEPCNQCSSCLEINAGRALDLLEIDAASHRGIDEMKELRDGIRFFPSKSKYKVFILDEAHQLSKDAANALLKTLEEPPSHAIFILATTEIHKMIPTIISRCQRFDFRKLTLPEIIKRLDIIREKEKAKVERAALELIAVNSGGSIRDAESLFDQVLTFSGQGSEIKAESIKDLLGLVEVNTVSQFCGLLSDKKASQAISFLNGINDKGMDLQEFAKALINYLRQALILKIAGTESGSLANPLITGLTKEEFQRLQTLSAGFKEEEVRKMLNLFLEAENKMKYSSIPQLPLELAIIECASEAQAERSVKMKA
jgi:DNA polymerase-3 subunit gamma/tau